MGYVEEKVLELVKYRLDRMPTDTSRDGYLKDLIQGSYEELQEYGIKLSADSMSDTVLLADCTAWKYNNRDEHVLSKGVSRGPMPQWLWNRIIGRTFHNKDDGDET